MAETKRNTQVSICQKVPDAMKNSEARKRGKEMMMKGCLELQKAGRLETTVPVQVMPREDLPNAGKSGHQQLTERQRMARDKFKFA